MTQLKELHTFLIHGLGGSPWFMVPLQQALKLAGYTNLHCLRYQSDKLTLAEMVKEVDREMAKVVYPGYDGTSAVQPAMRAKVPVVLIGQSIGGVISNRMHALGWNVRAAVYVASPLHGASLLNQLEPRVPEFVKQWKMKPAYNDLKKCERSPEPPHPYRTFSAGWFWSRFDGCVYQSETVLKEEHHTHLAMSDHRTVFVDPRLFLGVRNALKAMNVHPPSLTQ